MAGNVPQQVNDWLTREKHVRVNCEWLEACIEWINEERGSPAPLTDLRTAVYEQWLYSDLKESGEGFLPSNLHGVQAQFVRGDFCLQVNSVLNVAASLYSQLQKVRGQELDEAEDTSFVARQNKVKSGEGSHLLYLELTDGRQTIHAMEYQCTAPVISAGTEPGAKVLLHGPLQCRLGVLLLTSGSMEVLGGNVEALQEENSMVRVLARALGNESLAVPQSGALQTPSAASQHCPTTTAQDSRHQPVAPSSTSSQQTGRVFPPPQQSRPSSQCSGVQPPVPAASTLSQPVGNQLPRPAPPWMDTSSLGNDDFDDIDFNDFDDFDIPEEALQPAAQQPRPTPQSSLSCPSTVGGAPSLGNRPSLPSPAFTTEDWSALSQKSRPVCKVEPLQSKPPQTIVLDDSPPLARKLPQVDAKKVPSLLSIMTISQFKSSSGKVSSPVKIKAHCSGTLEKLTYEGDQWRLLVSVEDSTGSMAVYFSNEILEEFIGFSAAYFKNKMEPFRSTSKDVRARGRKGFSQCQSTLSQLDCWMEVRTVPELRQPQVYKVY